MTNLGIAGAVSLGSINQWISVINTNLTNSKKIGYKETKLSFTSGEVSSNGTAQGVGKTVNVTFPSASLEIAKTQILDYVQGNITPTGNITDFALNGQGYFVVEDKFGEKYATRDGQFNFDTDGYLVTLEGLRVLTSGMDYIRVPASERFSVNSQGESQVLSNDPLNPNLVLPVNQTFNPASNVASLNQSIYGMKRLMVIDIVPETKLLYSKYGMTKFQLGSRIPVVVKNDFSEVTDGVNTGLIPDSVVETGFPRTIISTGPPVVLGPSLVPAKKMADYFKHDIKNGVLKMSTHDVGGTQNRYVQAAVTSQRVGDFNFEMDYHLRENGGGLNTGFGVTIGKRQHSDTDQDNGIFIGAGPGAFLTIRQNGAPISSTGYIIATSGELATNTTLNPLQKWTLKVDAIDGLITARIMQGGALVATSTISNNTYKDGYMSVGTSASSASLSGSSANASDNVIDITKINLVERRKDSEYVVGIIQKNVIDLERNGDPNNPLNLYDKRDNGVTVIQQSVEESTATLAEALPQLSLAQKMFSAVSKIISVYNTMTDDTNSLLR